MNSLKGYIKETGWAKFIAVVDIVGGILDIPIGISLIILGTKLGGTNLGAVAIIASIVIATLIILIGILLIIAGIKLWSTANNLENYTNTEKEEDLKEAIKNLSDYFIFAGWAIVIGLAMVPISIIATLFLGSSMPGPIIY
jgi:uncharacterized membrane protein YidH (DUF202 family)